MAELTAEQVAIRPRRQPQPSVLSSVLRFARRKPLSAVGAVILILLVSLVAIGPLVLSGNPNVGSLRDHLKPPGSGHIFGTDQLGRDLFIRTLYGGRLSLIVGIGAATAGTVAGTILGVVSGYLGGKFDLIFQRFMDAWMSIPGIVLLMTLATLLGPSQRNTILAIAILGTPSASRIVRSAVLAVKAQPFVEAATSLGASPVRVMLRHVLPNVMGPILVIASVGVGGAILAEAGLGYLGLSVPPPFATWGTLLSSGSQNFMEQAPWMAVVPGVAIALTVFSVNLLGDGLRDVLDPRLRGSGK